MPLERVADRTEAAGRLSVRSIVSNLVPRDLLGLKVPDARLIQGAPIGEVGCEREGGEES